MYFVLLYEYVDNILEKRAPFRETHLELLNEYARRGELIFGGALTNPVDRSISVFKADKKSLIEKFVENDPYVMNGLIAKWEIREWNVVVGSGI